MAITGTVTVEQAIAVLNRAVQADPEAMKNLFATQVVVNERLENDPEIPVSLRGDNLYAVSPLDVINAIFGIDSSGFGTIAAVWENDGYLREFVDRKRRGPDGQD